MITAGLRRAIGADDPQLRPGPVPGSYTSSLPFRLDPGDPRTAAEGLAARLREQLWIAKAEVTGPGFVTVTVTPRHPGPPGDQDRPRRPGLRGERRAGRPYHRPAPFGPASGVADWPQARAALAAELTVRLAAAAGAIIDPERAQVPAPPPPSRGPVAEAVAYAGPDAVRFALARMPPGGRAPEAAVIARHVLANPAYAVRYAHAAAAAVLRWAAALGTRPAGFTPRLLAEPGELALLDALSWLPERVAVAARRGRPDEFAGYLAELAARTIDTMSTSSFRKIPDISSERLWLADAARTGLAAGLGLLGIDAPSRL